MITVYELRDYEKCMYKRGVATGSKLMQNHGRGISAQTVNMHDGRGMVTL